MAKVFWVPILLAKSTPSSNFFHRFQRALYYKERIRNAHNSLGQLDTIIALDTLMWCVYCHQSLPQHWQPEVQVYGLKILSWARNNSWFQN